MDVPTAVATPDPDDRPARLRLNTPVHYVAHGTPVQPDGGQAFTSQCRAAVVAEVYPQQGGGLLSGGEIQEYEPAMCALVVLNPTGMFFNDAQQDEDDRAGGTWHFPDNCGVRDTNG
ncbi:MAG TPA: hypothetical protein VHX38_02585 [Pseudonocardiaceae bacterium]|jgi:hypothetical protein|nr:hypothetical protein [Pseudonocardiaceae bacterium]